MSIHYHLTRNGIPGEERYPDQVSATAAMTAAADRMREDWENREGGVRLTDHGPVIVADCGDRYVSDRAEISSAACAGSCDRGRPVTVSVEVWAVSADENGLWLVSGTRPWRDGPVTDLTDQHAMVEQILAVHHADGAKILLHSTSWRPDERMILLTYLVALACPDVLNHWPHAKPISLPLARAVRAPLTHAATEVPLPRDVDVLFHALGHIHQQIGGRPSVNRTTLAALTEDWKRHLKAFEPTLAGMYDREHEAAAS